MTGTGGPAHERAGSSRFVDAVIMSLAIWTVCFHGTVFLGGSLATAVGTTAGCGLVVFGAWMRGISTASMSAVRTREVDEPVRANELDPPDRLSRRWLVGALAVVAAGVLPLDAETKWGMLAAYILMASVASGTNWLTCNDQNLRIHESEAEPLVWLLAFAGGILATVMLEPGPDDSATLNFAVVAADSPWAPLMQGDEMHGVPGLPLLFDFYRLEALPAACGAVAWLLGVTAKLIMHRVLPFLMGLLTVLVHARLARRLAGDNWMPVFLSMLVLIFATDWGPFAFMRLVHYGKIALFTVITPLLICYALEFSVHPAATTWRRLAGGQIAALGFSTTAVWAAPLIPGATLIAFWSPTKAQTLLLLKGVAASAYVVCAGLIVLAISSDSIDALPWFSRRLGQQSFWADSLVQAARAPRLRWVAFGSIPLAIAVTRGRIAHRVLLALAVVCGVLLVNPWLVSVVAPSITGVTTYWRAFLAFPSQLTIALVVASPMLVPARPGNWVHSWRVGLTGLMLAVAVIASPKTFMWPAIDALETSRFAEGYPAAKRVAELAGPEQGILAPEAVAQWTTTFQKPPYPLVARRIYLYVLSPHLGADEYARRASLERYVSGEQRDSRAATLLASALDAREVTVVAFAASAPWKRELRQTLRRGGMRRDSVVGRFEIWANPS